MTPRERYRTIMDFGKPDILPWIEWFNASTLLDWIYEGKLNPHLIRTRAGVGDGIWGLTNVNLPTSLDFPTDAIFGCIYTPGLFVPFDHGPIPRFFPKLVADTDDYYEVSADTSVRIRMSKRGQNTFYSMPMYTDWPVKDRESWKEYKKRLDPKDPRRLPKDWHPDEYKEAFKAYEAGPTRISFNGLFGFGAQLMGIERWIIALYKDPYLVHDIADFWEDFTIELFKPALDAFGEHIDTTWWWEDMAEKHGPFLSPRLFEKFFLFRYKRVTRFLHDKGIRHIMMDSDGNLNPLLEMLIEGGIDGLWPLEVNAGMNIADIREKHGNRIWLGGNIDKRKAALGGKIMREEVDEKVKYGQELGGYALGLDHLVPEGFSYDKFEEYSNYVKKSIGYEARAPPKTSYLPRVL